MYALQILGGLVLLHAILLLQDNFHKGYSALLLVGVEDGIMNFSLTPCISISAAKNHVVDVGYRICKTRQIRPISALALQPIRVTQQNRSRPRRAYAE